MVNKVKGILPYHVIAFVFTFLVTIYVQKLNIKGIVILAVKALPNFFLIQMAGIEGIWINEVEWYLSAMLIAIFIIYPICKKNYSLFVNVIAPIGGLLLIGYVSKTYGSLIGIDVWTPIGYKAVLRAVAEIALGTVTFELCRKLRKIKLSQIQKIFLTIIELFCYLVTLAFIVSTAMEYFETYILFILAIAVTISFSGITYGAQFFNKTVFYLLGKLSLPVYLCQIAGVLIVPVAFREFKVSQQIIAIVFITMVLAIICMVLGKFAINSYKTSWVREK
jgi:hypothetical protein